MRNLDWTPKLFAAIDAMDARAFCRFITEDGSFRFGNAPAVKGVGNISAAVAGFFSSIQGLRHQVSKVWAPDGDAVIAEGEVTYTRKNGSTLTVPFVNVFAMKGDLVDSYKIYIDLGQLYSA
jgi:ketosteroid isomerase-like protein